MKLFDVYPLFNIEPVKAQGVYIWDKKGVKYLDMYGGHAVISIGHNNPEYCKKINNQLNKIGFYSNSVINSLQKEMAEKLGELSGYPDYQLFLCNSGAEANENAIKLASFFNGRKKVIAFENSFHGRTSAAVAVTDNPSIRAPFNEMDNVFFLPLNDEEALETTMRSQNICAVIVEGIQGVGGIQIPSAAFLQKIETLCRETGALLILDEIQSGYGRSGKFFAHQFAGIRPALITVAKGMGNGFPLGGVLIHPEIEASHGLLGTTFGGNHLACAAGIAVLDVIKKESLVHRASQTGLYLIEKLEQLSPKIKEVRGLGLMIGIELQFPCQEVRKKLLFDYKIISGSSSHKNTLRILPPLCLQKQEADLFLEAISRILSH